MAKSGNGRMRIGLLGLDHDHVWTVAPELLANTDAQILVASDPDPELRAKAERTLGVRTLSDSQALLEVESLDAVCICTDNRQGTELAIEAADRGLAVMIEKPMARNTVEAERMIDAANRNGTRLMINWPFAWWPNLQHAMRLVLEENAIGRLLRVCYRASHEGIVAMGHSRQFAAWAEDAERAGGGALVDYCCYGAVLARVLLGKPEAVSGLAGNFARDDIAVEDNAVILMKYPRAMAVAEASWTQHGKLDAYTPVLQGEKGGLRIGPRAAGGLVRADLENPAGVPVEVPAAPTHMTNATAHFLWALKNDQPFTPLCQPGICRDATAILDAGLASVAGNSALVEVA
jgi:predicted dehydrogenase